MSVVHSAEVIQPKPLCIGRGSFAQVWTIPGTVVAFKEAQREEERDDIAREFKMCGEVYDHCGNDSFFSVPRALVLSIPSELGENAVFKLSPAPVKTPVTTQHPNARPIVRQEQFSSFGNATYAMDLVPPLPEHAASRLRRAYFPPAATAASGPNLCRLYFGKEYGTRRSQFANTHNFPLDVARYDALMGAYPDMRVFPHDIARGMGETLGRIHLHAGYDGRDIEFVLGGDGWGGFSFWVIDFNQMREWRWASDVESLADVQPLVDSFFVNDPYYPRPRPSDALYPSFKAGYRSAFYASLLPLADRFLAAIEAEQAARDARAT